jgi:hypothetical protein
VLAAVYFDASNQLLALNRAGTALPLRLSVYQHQLDRCLVYLDDAHTRGTDLRLPLGAHGAVTLGKGMYKAKCVHACMRMRQLGRGHSLAFWASHEAHTAIAAPAAAASTAAAAAAAAAVEGSSSVPSAAATSAEVLAWTLANTAAAVPESMLQWASHGLGHARRAAAAAAHRSALAAAATGSTTAATAAACRKLAVAWQESEVTALSEFYGQPRQRTAVPVIAQRQLQQALERTAVPAAVPAAAAVVAAAGAAIVQRTERYAAHLCCFAVPCDEEQERELEQELEEEQEVERPPPALAHVPRLDPAVLALAQGVLPRRNSTALQPLSAAFSRTQLQGLSQQCAGWHLRTSVTREFLRVVQPGRASEGLDSFLRPPCWLVFVPSSNSSSSSRNDSRSGHSSCSSTVVLVSPYEANALMPAFTQSSSSAAAGSASLHMYATRMRPQQSSLLPKPALALPLKGSSSSTDSSSSSSSSTSCSVGVTAQQQAQLAVFSGSLFFATAAEQQHYCAFLGLCPRPRTQQQEAAFSSGSIERSGFVRPAERAAVASELVAVCKFKQCPVALAEKILHIRGHLSPLSHVSCVLSKGQLADIQQPAEGEAVVP